MRRLATFCLSVSLVVGLFFLTGCDSNDNGGGGGQDPALSLSTDALELTVPGGASTSDTLQFTANYVALDGTPTASATGDLTVNVANEEEGEVMFNVFYNGSVGDVVEEEVTVTGSGGDEEFSETLTATVAPAFISTNFSGDYATVADFEKDTVMTSGNTSAVIDSMEVSENTNGVASLRIEAASDGSVSFPRTASVPNADRFTFLVKPNPNTDFNLSITFTEEADGGTTSHSAELPISSADSWRKYTVRFDQLDGFNPVASRAGGNGPLTDIEMSADADVTFHVDGLYMASADQKLAEIRDFDRITFEYGPPAGGFCGLSFGTTENVAGSSDGGTARTLEVSSESFGCFGYNYGNLKPDVGLEASLSLKVSGADEDDTLYVFVETEDISGEDEDQNRPGEFNYSHGMQMNAPAGDDWSTLTVPLDSLGEDAAGLRDPGIVNVGFEARGDDPRSMSIDDVKIKPAGN